MRYFLAAFLFPGMAMAQQSVTLSPQEYLMIVTELAQRDPVVRMLMKKQEEATQKALTTEKTTKPDTDKP